MLAVPDRFVVERARLSTAASGAVVVALEDGVLTPAGGPPAGLPRLAGTLMHGVVDRHVHLGLVDGSLLASTPVVEVHDLGWIPRVAEEWRRRPHTGGAIRIAGPIITAPGGYPLGRSWAPDAMVRQVANPSEARAAVAYGAEHDHDVVKIALHAVHGMFDDPTLAAIIDEAHQRRLPVGVHAEGAGQAERALLVGADVLVHVPWSEVLPDALLKRMVDSDMTWISTLGIHHGRELRRAVRAARRFVELGGHVVYGTDMGNGPTPVGLNLQEIEALVGVAADRETLLTMLVGEPQSSIALERAVVVPGPPPTRADRVGEWLSDAVRLTRLPSSAWVPGDAPSNGERG